MASPLGQRELFITCLACGQHCPVTCDITHIKPIEGGLHYTVKVVNDSLAWLQIFVNGHKGPFRKPD